MNRLLTILAAVTLNLFLTLPGLGQSSKMLSGVVLNDAKYLMDVELAFAWIAIENGLFISINSSVS